MVGVGQSLGGLNQLNIFVFPEDVAAALWV